MVEFSLGSSPGTAAVLARLVASSPTWFLGTAVEPAQLVVAVAGWLPPPSLLLLVPSLPAVASLPTWFLVAGSLEEVSWPGCRPGTPLPPVPRRLVSVFSGWLVVSR